MFHCGVVGFIEMIYRSFSNLHSYTSFFLYRDVFARSSFVVGRPYVIRRFFFFIIKLHFTAVTFSIWRILPRTSIKKTRVLVRFRWRTPNVEIIDRGQCCARYSVRSVQSCDFSVFLPVFHFHFFISHTSNVLLVR